MITITHSPPLLSASKNPIAYALSTDNEEVKYLVIKIWVETELYSSTYKEITIRESPPMNGETVISIQDILDACLDYDLPDFYGGGIVRAKQLCKRYYVELAECTADQTLEELTWQTQSPLFVLKTKFPFLELPKRGSKGKNILSNLVKKTIGRTQTDFVTVMAFEARTLEYQLFQTNTEGQTITTTQHVGAVQAYEPVILPVSAGILANNIVKIGIKLLSSYWEYEIIDTEALESVYPLYYLNRLGGWDSCLGLGVFEDSEETERLEAEHFTPYDYEQTHQVFRSYPVSSGVKGVWRSGLMTNKEYELRTDINRSPQLFLRKEGFFVPISPSEKGIKGEDTDRFAEGIELKFTENIPL